MAADSIPVLNEEIQLSVVVEISEAAAGRGAGVGDHRSTRNLIEGAVSIVDKKQVGSVAESMRNEEVQVVIVVDITPGGPLGIAVVCYDRTSDNPCEVLSSKLCGYEKKTE